MPRTIVRSLTPLELELMQVLWRGGSGNVADVRRALERDLAYNSVQTMLMVLLKKKQVKRVLEGRAYRYHPIVSRQAAAIHALKSCIDKMFEGSGEALLKAMVDNGLIQIDEALSALLQKNQN